MIVHGRATTTRERAMASVERRIGEVGAVLAACERAGDSRNAAAARRFLDELKGMLAAQRSAPDTGEG